MAGEGKHELESPSQERSSPFWMAWAVVAAFGCYFCMYGIRKPFTAASFEETALWGIGFKTILVTTQVAGYMISKFIGIKVIAEMPRQRRAITLMTLVLFAEGALLLFGAIPRPYNAICLFFNGLPLGMVFGLVLGFLEGRKLTELLAAGLCLSFITADGVTKSVGKGLLDLGISEDWMPSAAGAIFLAPLAAFTAMLATIPPPSHHDVAARAERGIMDRASRNGFIRKYAIGLFPLVAIFLMVTIVRSIRADFGPEILQGMGMDVKLETFATSEMLVGLGVLLVNGAAVLIIDNRRAFFMSLGVCAIGFLLMTLALLGRDAGYVNPFYYYVLIGLGLYFPYVAFHTTVFERMLAMTREKGTTGFLMYVADSIGYLGYVAVMLASNYLKLNKSLHLESGLMANLLTIVCWSSIGVSAVCLLVSWRYFAKVAPVEEPPLKTLAAEATA